MSNHFAPGDKVIWRNGGSDIPATITTCLGEMGGERYYSILQFDGFSSPSGVPESQIISDNNTDLQWLADQGAKFALPKGRTKNKFSDGWQNEPQPFDKALAHAQAGGNVGILTGKHSANIIAIDRDIHFNETAEMLGKLAHTVKIVRTSAPDRGKFLYRINGEIPPTTSWKPEGAKRPEIEFLGDNGQRHALCPPSEFDNGQYVLIDTHYGIKEITPAQVDYIWRLVTGGSIYKEVRAQEEAEADKLAKNEYVQKVKEAWTVKTVFEHFDKAKNGSAKDRGETRLLGNGGLLISNDGTQWYCHADSIGGDMVDAFSWCKWQKKIDRNNPKMFWDAINALADLAHIEKPKPQAKPSKKIMSAAEYCAQVLEDEPLQAKWSVIRTHEGKTETVKIASYVGDKDGVRTYMIEGNNNPIPETELSVEVRVSDDSDNEDSEKTWVEDLRGLEPSYTFKLNKLEDTVEVNGERLDDITRSRIYLAMTRYKCPKTYVDDCINVLAAEQAYHPIKDYLSGLQWDGKDRLGLFLGHINEGQGDRYQLADGREFLLYAALLTRWLLGCVARGLDGDAPTAFKHQTPMLVLVGPQGIGKSSLIRWLVSGVGIEFHREGMLDPHHQDHVRSAVTKWIWEVSELGASLRRGDRDALKSFITQEWFTYRKPWGRGNLTKPLLCNFVGTINPEIGFLDDPTGHRRFLPITVTAINHGYKTTIDVNQLWAQLVHLYKNGVSPELSPEEKQALQPVYNEHEVEDPLRTYMQLYFDITPGDHSNRIFTAEIISRLQQFGVSIANDSKVAGQKISAALSPLHLERKFISIDGVKGWGWLGMKANAKRPPAP